MGKSAENPPGPDEAAESLFASWLERRDQGSTQEFEALVRERPALRDELARLHEAWRMLSAPAEDEPATEGALFAGHYRKLRLIGRGGQGDVWLAEDVRLARRVALKLLSLPDRDRLRRFAREAAVTSRLEHPNICPVYESGEAEGVAFIAMRYVEGQSLALWIARERQAWSQTRRSKGRAPSSVSGPSQPAAVARVVRILAKAARALDAAHDASIVHRDVKPGNILVTRDEEPVLVDFGFAADVEGDWSVITRSEQFLGTPAYMAPEQLQGKGRDAIDRRTDVWALGVTLYECLSGRRPFEGPTWQAIFRAIAQDEPPHARSLNPTLPADLECIVETAMAKERERRYASAGALASDLEAWLEGRPILARKTSLIGRVARWARRERSLASAVLLLALALPCLGALASYAVLTRRAVLAGEAWTRREELEALLLEAFAAMHEGSHATALRGFEQALAREPECAEALGGKLSALEHLGRVDELRAFAPEIARTLPALWSWLTRNASWIEGSRAGTAWVEEPALAATSIENLLLGVEARARLDTHLDDLASGEGPPLDSALRHLRTALYQRSSPNLVYLLEYVEALGHAPDAGPELELVRHVIETGWPDSSLALSTLASAFARHAPELGLELARRAVTRDPQSARAQGVLGVLLVRSGDAEGGLAAYDRALALDPTLASSHFNRGLALRKRGDLRGAAAAYRSALDCDPSSADVWSNLGVVLGRLGDIEAAIDAQREALRREPASASFRINLALDLSFAGELDESEALLREADELTRGRSLGGLRPRDLLENLARLREDSARLDAWIAGTLVPGEADQLYLAERAYALGRCDDCLSLLGSLLETDPGLAERTLGGPRSTLAHAAAWLSLRASGAQAARLRGRAVDALWAELGGFERLLADAPEQAAVVGPALEAWLACPGTAQLLAADLPPEAEEAERALVRELADRFEALRAETRPAR